MHLSQIGTSFVLVAPLAINPNQRRSHEVVEVLANCDRAIRVIGA